MELEARDVQVLKVVGDRIRLARLARRWSQEDLAFEAGINHQSLISDLERGKTSARLVTYSRIARALEVDLSTMFEGTP